MIHIRGAVQEDLPGLQDLYVEMVGYHRAHDPRWADEATAAGEAAGLFSAWLDHPRAVLLIADVEGTTVGFALGVMQAPHLALAPVRVGRLDLLAVTEAHRREGIGSVLARAVLDWFREQGVERVFVSSSAANPAANAFWERMGFEIFSVSRSLELA